MRQDQLREPVGDLRAGVVDARAQPRGHEGAPLEQPLDVGVCPAQRAGKGGMLLRESPGGLAQEGQLTGVVLGEVHAVTSSGPGSAR